MKKTDNPADAITHYLVGGAVRDQLLGLKPQEQDWVVVGATPQQMLALGFTPVGKDFPVFLHPHTKEEFALARTERKSGHGYGGFTFYAEPTVRLEDDLIRRDLTINAIAQDKNGNLIDPFNGQQDLTNKLLRHVSPAFVEDPLRVLRVARFAARFHLQGFRVADETLMLMQQLVDSGEIEHLVPERIWKETSRALMTHSPHVYFEVLDACGALAVLFPEIKALDGVPQTEKHHPEVDTLKHLYLCLEQSAKHDHPLITRYAVLCHDLGKGLTPANEWPKHHRHEHRGIAPTKALSERLKVPADVSALAQLTSQHHLNCHRAFELRPSTLYDLFKTFDYARRPERLSYFTQACLADSQGRLGFHNRPYPQADYLLAMAQASRVDASPFVAKGLKGNDIAHAIKQQSIAQIAEAKNTWLKQHS